MGLGFSTPAEAAGIKSKNASDVSHHFRLMILIPATPFHYDATLENCQGGEYAAADSSKETCYNNSILSSLYGAVKMALFATVARECNGNRKPAQP